MSRTLKSSYASASRLFDELPAAPPAGVHVANIDGASRGNPGPAAYAVILRAPDGSKITELAKRIGRETNNVAEYYALIAALDYAAANSIHALRVRSDSELLVRQMQGRYKVKSEDLRPLHERARKLARRLRYFVIEHVPREQNSEADALANLALDGGGPSLTRPAASLRVANDPAGISTALRIRALYHSGVFVPDQKVELPDGTQVELEIRATKKS